MVGIAMKLFCLDEKQCLPISIVDAWSFFSDTNNLTKITPASLGLEISSAPDGQMYAGMIITHRVKPLLSIPINWVTEITHVDKPRLFIDEQRFGPYRFWHHQHHFREINGGVEIRDIVHYSPFVGPIGTLVNALIVRGQLKQIFDYRRSVLEEKFGKLFCESE
jgi:ligand-binding SRPBCC domain-containing protein